MKRISILMAVLGMSIGIKAQHLASNITAKKIYVYLSQELDETSKDFFVRVAKMKNKWYLHKYDYRSKEMVDSQLIMNIEVGKFLTVKEEFKPAHLMEPTAYDNTLFRLYPYYGYNGYFLDNIRDLTAISDPTDDELYALGRSYSALYGNYCLGYNGFAKKSLCFDLPAHEPGQLNQLQLKKLDSVFQLCVSSYDKIYKRNPNYDTKIVGSIQTKMCNEYMYHYMNLCMLHNERYARKHLRKGLYDEHYRMLGENLLNSCPKNAILITSGDNDTYSALYVQKMYSVRQDVTIISGSLLGVHSYSNSLSYYEDVKQTIVFNKKNQDSLSYVYCEDKEERTSLENWISEIKKSLQENDTKSRLKVNNQILIGQVKLDLPPLIYRNDILVLDIILNNYQTRPICVSNSQATLVLKNLFNRMISHGMVFYIDWTSPSDKLDRKVSLNAYYFFAKSFKYSAGEKPMSSDNFYGPYQYDYPLAIAYFDAKNNDDDKKADFIQALYKQVSGVYNLKGLSAYDW